MQARTGVVCSALLLAAAALSLAGPALAGETLTYTYDALGRLVKVSHSGTVNSNTNACFAYDPADNRDNVTVSTTGDCTSTPAVSFSVSDVSVKEGGNLVFTVTKTGSASGTLSVDYATADGTALAPGDYTAKSGTLTFLSTDTSKTVSVSTVDDSAVESSETALLNLSNASAGSAIGDGQGIGTITDNETDCVGINFTIASNGPVSEGANSVFTVTKHGTTSNSCSVDYATANGPGTFPAAAPGDYTAKSGTLTFTSSETSKTVSVATTNDTTAENDETFSLTLSNPMNGSILGSPSTATATIIDNDRCAGVSFTVASNGAVTEGGGSTFTVTKSGSTTWLCSVNYATANGTAVAPGDYTAASGTLTFTSTQASQSVIVSTVEDSTIESAETFALNLSGPANGGILGTPNSATATINDDDSGGPCSAVSFSVNDPPLVVEGNPLTFTVSKAGATSSSCSVSYATANGTALAGTNYAAKSGTLTFTSTQTSQNVVVTTIDTQRAKGIRTMFLNLTNATGDASITDSQGTGSIDHSGTLCTTCLQSADPDPEPPSTDSTAPPDSSTTDPAPAPPEE
ncbi:MAG TPA: Calx-beta domain-containing protein [Sphingomicrobium sp.]|nr:Calx-beta domain-containing protein [Sphingomicrobium sp.]